MSPRLRTRLTTLAAAFAVLTASSAQADVVSTLGLQDHTVGSMSMLNYPNQGILRAVGQTFTAVNPNRLTLNSFAFNVRDDVAAPAFQFFAQVYSWSGTAITGPALFSTGPLSVSGQAFQLVTVPTGGLPLIDTQQYVALFSALGTTYNGSSLTFGAVGTGAGAAYTGGKLVYTDGPTLTTLPNRYNYGGDLGDLEFVLNFGPGPSVPEPSPLVLAAVASLVCGVPVVLRRRGLKAGKPA